MDMPTEAEPVRLVCGDCLHAMAEIPDGSIDCIVTDPPYCSEAAPEVLLVRN